MPGDYPQRLEWRKAQRSISNGACVEVASVAANVLIRDSQDVNGPVLNYSTGSWQAFLRDARLGKFGTFKI
jgi:Domain of unknown function (DUF397)